MGATWMSQRTTTTVIITVLQIQALISAKSTAVTGVEGKPFHFKCEYPRRWQSHAKYLCRIDQEASNLLIWTEKHDQWERNKSLSLYDNITAAFFIVKVDKLVPEDSGTYLCGVDINLCPDHITIIQLNVSQVTATSTSSMDLTVDRLHMPLFLTVVMCVVAMLFVCLFTLCLLLAVKQQSLSPHQKRESSSDYENMKPGVLREPDSCCSCSAPDSTDLSALPSPPPDFCSHFTSKCRESTVTLGIGEYVDVDVPGHNCQYQQLDTSQLEEHVYHSLHGNSSPKDGSHRVKDQSN
ncbi:uncharacterized protein LOC113128573 [Mastacembelus armatus]|uniref:uncharacterized protein LOC113128573 n=1 Tax=Mastacembelus armatus TaxID=205130 RepID=UPI000E45B461|nr:uncharacterized protein LOC113128573 [Mastacembelus armatus]